MPRRRKNFSKAVQKIIDRNVETKTHVLQYSTTIMDPGRSPLDNSLVELTQGDTQSGRDGNEVRIKSVQGDFFITGADSTNSIRVILYKPKNVSDSLSADAIDFNGTPDLDKYVILRDWLVCTNSTGAMCKRLRFKKFFRGSGMSCRYTGSSGTTITTNKLSLYMVSDSGAISDPGVEGYVRVRYKDA